MKYLLIPFFTATCALLTGCYGHPHSYCHHLTSELHRTNHGGTNNRINAADKARIAREYEALDCDGQ